MTKAIAPMTKAIPPAKSRVHRNNLRSTFLRHVRTRNNATAIALRFEQNVQVWYRKQKMGVRHAATEFLGNGGCSNCSSSMARTRGRRRTAAGAAAGHALS